MKLVVPNIKILFKDTKVFFNFIYNLVFDTKKQLFRFFAFLFPTVAMFAVKEQIVITDNMFQKL
jgi:hypothetical protein